MRFLLLMLILLPCLGEAQTYDLILKGGRIVDGTGNAWFYGDVAVTDGKIARVGKLENAKAERVLDVKGMVVAPGFIDVHTHLERNDVQTPTADNFIFDGVTSVVTGNCGSSRTDLSRYFFLLDSVGMSINVASLIGHNSVRNAVMGMAMRDPTAEEQRKMEAMVAEAM